jgi:hypothetical protein
LAHVSRSIDVEEPVGSVYEKWTRFDETAPALAEDRARVHWRAEVLSFEPRGSSTCVTLRIEYDPVRNDPGLSRSVERTLEDFRSYLERARSA